MSQARSFRELGVLLSLGSLASLEGVKSSRLRSLRWSLILLGASSFIALLFLEKLHLGELNDLIGARMMAYASWLYGGLGLAALLKVPPGATPFIARLRGKELTTRGVRSLGIALALSEGFALAGLPAFLLSLFLAKTSAVAFVRVGQTLAITLYCVALGLALGVIGELSERLAPKSPRSLASLFVLFPFVLSFVAPGIPSLPGACAVWLDFVTSFGAPL